MKLADFCISGPVVLGKNAPWLMKRDPIEVFVSGWSIYCPLSQSDFMSFLEGDHHPVGFRFICWLFRLSVGSVLPQSFSTGFDIFCLLNCDS